MLLNSEESDGALIVRFTDAKILDEATILQTGKELMELLPSAADKKKMVLDLESVQFMSSAMIGKLVLLNKKAKAEQIELKLRNIKPNVYEVFKLTRLNRVFDIEE